MTTRTIPRAATRVLLLTVMLACSARGLYAQGGAPQPSGMNRPGVPMTVALVTNMGYGGASAVILRQPDFNPADVILLRAETATAEQLTEAILGLLSIRKARGDLPTGNAQVLQVKAVQAGPKVIPWTATLLKNLTTTQPQDIPGVGKYPAVQVMLPRQQAQK